MEKPGHDEQRTTQKKADLEELWATNTVQESLKQIHATLPRRDPLFAQEDAKGLQRQDGRAQRTEIGPHLAPQAEHLATPNYSPAIHAKREH